MKKSVSKEFYDYCLERFPALRKGYCACSDNAQHPKLQCPWPRRFRRLFRYVAFSTFVCKHTNRLILSHSILKHLAEVKDNGFNTYSYINKFTQHVLPNFKTSSYVKGERGRRVVDNGFDFELCWRIENETLLDLRTTDKKVMFDSGKVWDRNTKTYLYKTTKEEYQNDYNIFAPDLSQAQRYILQHLSSINPKSLSEKINENYQSAKDAITKLPNAETQEIQYRILAAISENPSIYYYPTHKSPRLSAHNDTVIGLKKVVREALCKGWSDADLKNSQFAIVAQLTNSQKCIEFIKSGKSLWQELAAFEGVEYTADQKRQYKQLIYGICFGASVEETSYITYLNRYAKPEDRIIPLAKRYPILIKHPLIAELTQNRKVWHERIRQDGYGVDVWGNLQRVSAERNVRSIAAYIAQSYELEIISSIFEQASIYEKMYMFSIKYFQHDGFTVAFQSTEKKDRAISWMKNTVESRAKELGIITTLEVEEL